MLGLWGCFRPSPPPRLSSIRIPHDIPRDVAADLEEEEEEAYNIQTLDQKAFVARALKHHPRLAVATARRRGAQAMLDGADFFAKPEIRIGNIDPEELSAGNGRVDVALRLKMNSPFEATADNSVRQAMANVAKAENQQIRAVVMRDAAHLFIDLAVFRRQVHHLQRTIEAVQRRRRVTDKLLLEQAATKSQSILTSLTLHKLLARQEGVVAALEQAEARASTILGLPTQSIAHAQLMLKTDASDVAPVASPSESPHPEVGVALAKATVAESELFRAKMKNIPWIGFVQAERQTGFGAETSAWSLGAALEFPLFHFGLDDIAEREANFDAQIALAKTEALKLNAEHRASTLRFQRARARLQDLESLVVQDAQGVENLLDAANSEGTDPIARLMLYEKWEDMRQLYLEALRSCLKARVDLMWLRQQGGS